VEIVFADYADNCGSLLELEC